MPDHAPKPLILLMNAATNGPRRLRAALPPLIAAASLALAACGDDPDDLHLVQRHQGVLIEDLPELGGDYPDVLIQGLSRQLIDELNCIEPGALAEFESAPIPGRLFTENNIPHMLRPEAIAAAEAVAELEGDHLTITSGYRDVGMQYYDYLRGQRFGFLAGRPGSSRHQAGQAIDVLNNTFWRDKLIDYGWQWPLGERDRPHFEWHEENAIDLRPESVRAFQRLWNRNAPDDPIAEDGDFGPQTEARLAITPAEGLPFGGCDLDLDSFTDTLAGGDDCDDERSDVHPGAPEICGDGVDQDCDGDDTPCTTPEPEPTPEPEANPEPEPEPEDDDTPPDRPDAEPEALEPEPAPPSPPPAITQTRADACACASLAFRPSPTLNAAWMIAALLALGWRRGRRLTQSGPAGCGRRHIDGRPPRAPRETLAP